MRTAGSRWPLPVALAAGVFGIATVVSGGRVLFGPEAARAGAGHYVPFVLWFNFLAGFAYLVAALGIAWRRRWAATLSLGIAVATGLVFAALGVHVALGGAFETRTVAAMTFRTAFWGALAVATRRLAPPVR